MQDRSPQRSGLRPASRHRATGLALLGLLGAGEAAGSDPSWVLRRQEDGVTVHTRAVPGSSLEEFRGVTRIRAPLRALVEMLLDVDRYPEWMHDCREARVLERRGIEGGLTYTVTDAPWPVRDRDVVARWTLTQDAAGGVTIAFVAEPEALPPRDGHVRVPRTRGLYRLTPGQDGSTEVLYQLHSDSGGLLPGWLARSWVVAIPFHSLRNLPGHLARTGYTGREEVYRAIREPPKTASERGFDPPRGGR